MRKSNEQNISDLVKEYLKKMQIDDKIKEHRIAEIWEMVLGKTIANQTKNIFIKNKVLFVYMHSSIVRNELMMMREGIIKAINDKYGEKMIEKIVLQ
jgi:predicted nucleic acid-binding Zn ribbon protein